MGAGGLDLRRMLSLLAGDKQALEKGYLLWTQRDAEQELRKHCIHIPMREAWANCCSSQDPHASCLSGPDNSKLVSLLTLSQHPGDLTYNSPQ